jgi:DNA-binding NarL/FixJ family response regulator
VIPIRVLLADDHALFVRVVKTLFDGDTVIEVAATAETAEAAVQAVVEFNPAVVLMDLNMPVIGGVEATRRIIEFAPHVAVVVLTMFDDDESIIAALRAGARGYLLKGAREDEIRRAILAAAHGEAVIGRTVAHRLVSLVGLSPPPNPFPQLTAREHEILGFIAQGRANGQIAEQLALSAKTVRNYVSTIMTKLQAETRAQLIATARDAGIGARPS